MYRNILVPMGLAEPSDEFLDTVASLAVPRESRVTILHVIETVADTAFDDLEDFYEGLRRRAEATLEKPASRLVDRGLEVQVRIAYGKRAPEIVRHASESCAELIALISHFADPDDPGRGFLSISHQVAVMAPCSVLMIR
jgi:nucleotide-binding universal stress UspA family protein